MKFILLCAVGLVVGAASAMANGPALQIAPGTSVTVDASDQSTVVSCTATTGLYPVDKYCTCTWNMDQQAYDLTRVVTYSDASVHRDLINQGLNPSYCQDQINGSRVCAN